MSGDAHVPTFIHACQSYKIGSYRFGKRNIAKNLYTDCNAKLLRSPPSDVLDLTAQAEVLFAVVSQQFVGSHSKGCGFRP